MILSISRRTDIPAFYPEWLMNRFREGFALVRNPVNHHGVSRISLSPDVVDCIVFWTKNPAPLLPFLDQIAQTYPFYFQFTLNAYGTYHMCHVTIAEISREGAVNDGFDD